MFQDDLLFVITDVNECDDENGTHHCSQICINTPGSYHCKCKPGFVLSTNKRICNGMSIEIFKYALILGFK